jgi:hypothetical protein
MISYLGQGQFKSSTLWAKAFLLYEHNRSRRTFRTGTHPEAGHIRSRST